MTTVTFIYKELASLQVPYLLCKCENHGEIMEEKHLNIQ